MTDLVVFPDLESALIAWAPGALATQGFTVTVSDVLQGNDSVAIYSTGGVQRMLVIDSPTIVVEVKAATGSRCSDIIQMLRALIKDLVGQEVGGIWVQGYAEFSGPANLPLEDSPFRYTMTLSIDAAGRVVN